MTCRLYLITPPQFELDIFVSLMEEALDAGDVACVQLRLKPAHDAAIKRAAERLLPLCHAKNIPLLLNDRPDLVKTTGADGCHIGQEDMRYDAARDVVGEDKIIGVTCHNSRHLAMLAGDAGANYVAFGAFYPSQTKPVKSRAMPEMLSWWQELMELPCVAIGGITAENAPPLIAAGADFLAVSHAIWTHPDGAGAAVREFNALF